MSTAENHASTAEDQILSLLSQWHERRARGDDPLDELCRDNPEVADEVRRRAHVLEHLERLAGGPAPSGQQAGGSPDTISWALAGPEFLAPPQAEDELG